MLQDEAGTRRACSRPHCQEMRARAEGTELQRPPPQEARERRVDRLLSRGMAAQSRLTSRMLSSLPSSDSISELSSDSLLYSLSLFMMDENRMRGAKEVTPASQPHTKTETQAEMDVSELKRPNENAGRELFERRSVKR